MNCIIQILLLCCYEEAIVADCWKNTKGACNNIPKQYWHRYKVIKKVGGGEAGVTLGVTVSEVKEGCFWELACPNSEEGKVLKLRLSSGVEKHKPWHSCHIE